MSSSQGIQRGCEAASSALLDPPEISVPTVPPPTAGQKWVHRRWFQQRDAVLRLMSQRASDAVLFNRLLRCGTNGQVQWSPSRKRYRVAITACKSSLCPRCRNARALKLQDRITFALGDHPKHEWKMLTLTLRSSSQPLTQQTLRIKKHFRGLRRLLCSCA